MGDTRAVENKNEDVSKLLFSHALRGAVKVGYGVNEQTRAVEKEERERGR
jgi:hypothetical protein